MIDISIHLINFIIRLQGALCTIDREEHWSRGLIIVQYFTSYSLWNATIIEHFVTWRFYIQIHSNGRGYIYPENDDTLLNLIFDFIVILNKIVMTEYSKLLYLSFELLVSY